MAVILTSLRNTVIAGFVLALILLLMYVNFGNTLDLNFWTFIVRWLHVVCGVMWIGLLWYFNFVQMPSMPKIPDDQKPAVSKVIAPEALFWFRWGAMGTIVFGIVLAHLNGYLLDAYTLGAYEGFAVPKHIAIGIGMHRDPAGGLPLAVAVDVLHVGPHFGDKHPAVAIEHRHNGVRDFRFAEDQIHPVARRQLEALRRLFGCQSFDRGDFFGIGMHRGSRGQGKQKDLGFHHLEIRRERSKADHSTSSGKRLVLRTGTEGSSVSGKRGRTSRVVRLGSRGHLRRRGPEGAASCDLRSGGFAPDKA